MREFVLHILERGTQRHFHITFFRAELIHAAVQRSPLLHPTNLKNIDVALLARGQQIMPGQFRPGWKVG